MKQNIMYGVLFALLVGLGSFGVSQAYASDTTNKAVQSVTATDTYGDWNISPVQAEKLPQYKVCVFTAWDGYMDQSLSGIVLGQVTKYTNNATIVSMKEQILDQGKNCGTIIKIDRAINQNYGYTDRATPYQISGNTLTVFTYKTTNPFNPNAQPMHAMLNWNCELQAHESKYFSNYHISNEGYYHTYRGYCNPYYMQNPEKIGELAPNAIKQSIDDGLKKLGV